MSAPHPLPETVLCIPGPWRDHSELVEKIASRSPGYLFAGRVLVQIETHESFELQHEVRDARMASAFRTSGSHWADTEEMERIAEHESVVYLIGPGGSRQNAQAMMLAGQALLDAGGLGVKVESSGISHSPSQWREFCETMYLFSAYKAFVVNVTGAAAGYTCGMHTLGLKDVIVRGLDASVSVPLVGSFSWYAFTEEPAVHAGQTFSMSADSPVYRIGESAGVDHGEGSLFANPFGFWELEPV